MKTPFLFRPRPFAPAALALSAFMLALAPGLSAQDAPPPNAAPAADPAAAPAAPVELPPGAQDVVKLTQAGLNEDVIIAQVRSAGFIYRLTADQIIALTNAGVSQNVIRALIEPSSGANMSTATTTAPISGDSAPPSPPSAPPPASTEPAPDAATAAPPTTTSPATPDAAPPSAPPAAPINFDYVQSQLSPYGMWIQVSPYGWAWVPSEAAGNPFWQPYADAGQWVYTDLGWYWNSSYAWGGIPFHYGRWVKMERYGWAWIPDYTWGPAWVCWRYDETDGYCGWAPLPPGARFVPGLGLYYHGRLALDIDFGLRWEDFVFCGYGHLLDRNVRPFLLPRVRIAYIFDRSFVRNNYAVVNGRFAVEGLGRARLEVLTHRELRPAALPAPVGWQDRGRVYPPAREPYYRPEVRPVGSQPVYRPVGGPYETRPAVSVPGTRPPRQPPAPVRPAERPVERPAERPAEPARSNPPPASNSDKNKAQTN